MLQSHQNVKIFPCVHFTQDTTLSGGKINNGFSSDFLCCVDSRQTVFIYAFLLIICLLAFYLNRFDDNKDGLCKKLN